MTKRAEVQSAIRAAKGKALRANDEKTCRNIFLDGYESTK